MYIDNWNILTKYDDHHSFRLGEEAFCAKRWKKYVLTHSDLFLTSDKKVVIDFSLCLIKTRMITKFGDNQTLSWLFHVLSSLTSSDHKWTFIFNSSAPHMCIDNWKMLTKYDDHQSFRLGEEAFCAKRWKKYVLTHSDLFLTSDKKVVINFSLCLIKTHMITKFGENRTLSWFFHV